MVEFSLGIVCVRQRVKSPSFAYKSFSIKVRNWCIEWSQDACPFELVSNSPKLKFWLNVSKVLQKKMDTIILIKTFPDHRY